MGSEKFMFIGGQRGGGKIFHLQQTCTRLAAERDALKQCNEELMQKLMETLADMKQAAFAGDLCGVCAHSENPGPCEGADFLCSNCPAECICKNCVNGENFQWRGHGDA